METNPLDVARGISDFGFIAVTAAFYLAVTGMMMFFFVKWFVKIVNNIINGQQKAMDELLSIQKAQFSMVKDIKESIGDESLNQAIAISDFAFDFSKMEVIRSLEKVKKQNHIEDRKAIERKIKKTLNNLHKKRSSKFDLFTYAGKKLSAYADPAWIDRIGEIMLHELYAESFNLLRATANVNLAYEEIKTEFYQNLKNGHYD